VYCLLVFNTANVILLPVGRTVAAPEVQPGFAVNTPLQTGEQLSNSDLS